MALQAPANYTIGLPDPTAKVMEGAEAGVKLATNVQAYNAREAAAAGAQAAAQAQAGRQAMLSADLEQLTQKPTVANVTQLAIKYPELSEHTKRLNEMLEPGEKENRIQQASKFYAAVSSATPEEAASVARTQAEAYRNSGMDAEAKELEDLATLAMTNPVRANIAAATTLAGLMGPDKFSDTFSKLEAARRDRATEGVELSKKQSEARSAAVAANFAESNAVQDLEKKGWDITKIQEDTRIARQNVKIASFEAQIKKETNDIAREKLTAQRDEERRKQEVELREKTAKLESDRANIDNMLNTAVRIEKTPASVLFRAAGPIVSNIFTVDSDTLRFEEQLKLFGNQAFLAQLPNMAGFGSLSVAEKQAMETSLQSFALRQSGEDVIRNVRETRRLLLKMRKNLTTRYGAPDTIPDTPDMSKPTKARAEAIMSQLEASGEL